MARQLEGFRVVGSYIGFNASRQVSLLLAEGYLLDEINSESQVMMYLIIQGVHKVSLQF